MTNEELAQLRKEWAAAVRRKGEAIIMRQPNLGFAAYERAASELNCPFDIVNSSHMLGPDFELGLYRG